MFFICVPDKISSTSTNFETEMKNVVKISCLKNIKKIYAMLLLICEGLNPPILFSKLFKTSHVGENCVKCLMGILLVSLI